MMAFRSSCSLIKSNLEYLIPSLIRTPSRKIHYTNQLFSAGIVQHRHTPDNNDDTPFEWNSESLELIKPILKKFPKNRKKSAVIPLLYIAQEQGDNWLPLNAMKKVAETLDMAPLHVYEVATFYTMFNRTPVGKYHIQLCGTTPCEVCGSEAIKAAMLDYMGVHEGEVTSDGYFSLNEVECLGACVNAPMIQVNNQKVYENLTTETAVELLKTWKAGGEPEIGPQNGLQVGCEGPQGKTSLLDDELPEPICRDLDALRKEIEEAQKEAEKS